MRIHLTCSYCKSQIETGVRDRLGKLPKGARWFESVFCNVCKEDRVLDVGDAVHRAIERDHPRG